MLDPLVDAFANDVFWARTTLKALLYCKKLAAVKKYSKLVESGFPNVFTNSCSLEIETISSTGPLPNEPATAPILVDTAGIILVKSLSCTRTQVILEMPSLSP